MSTVIDSNSLFALQAFFSFPRFFVPVVDGGVLPEAPEALMAAGNFNKDVSVISGTVKDEGAFFYRYRRLTEFGPPMWQAEAYTELTLSVTPATAEWAKFCKP